MTEYKSHYEGAVLNVSAKQDIEVIRDWPTHYYNTARYRQYVSRRAWYRRGKTYKSLHNWWEYNINRMTLDVKLQAAKEFVDNLENRE